jgi:hypothetical protein
MKLHPPLNFPDDVMSLLHRISGQEKGADSRGQFDSALSVSALPGVFMNRGSNGIDGNTSAITDVKLTSCRVKRVRFDRALCLTIVVLYKSERP